MNDFDSCGSSHVVAIAEDGTVEFWGDFNAREHGYHAWTMPLARLKKLKARPGPLSRGRGSGRPIA